jgi:hypothetical protein
LHSWTLRFARYLNRDLLKLNFCLSVNHRPGDGPNRFSRAQRAAANELELRVAIATADFAEVGADSECQGEQESAEDQRGGSRVRVPGISKSDKDCDETHQREHKA